MNLARATELAEAVTTERQAALLYHDVEAEISLGSGYEEEDYDAADQALALLEERFPGARAAAHQVISPPALSRSAGRSFASGPDAGRDRARRKRRGGGTGNRGSAGRRPETAPRTPPEPVPVRPGWRLGVLLALVVVVVILVAAAGGPGPCPSGTTYDGSVLSDTCTRPDRSTDCVLYEFGYAPARNDRGFEVAATPATGPRWCPGAASFEGP